MVKGPVLFVFGGLPGVGKTELAAHLAKRFPAVYLRIDTIEQAMRQNGYALSRDEGYQVAYALARDNLKAGMPVVADSVNPLEITRKAWRDVARSQNATVYEVEVLCSNPLEHKKRVESRTSDISDLVLPTWDEVVKRPYDPWGGPTLVIDTAGKSPAESKTRLKNALLGLGLTLSGPP